MRPHRLRLTAFGPFGGEAEVDFDTMAAGGLFLLQGDTGAGKTSILDALAFALYGSVPGQRSGPKRLRSDHADPSLRTSVELEVTLGRRRLKVTRWPEQERPKQRGSGTTRDPAKVLLQEAVDGGWRTVSTRVQEADAELHGLLGMSAEQFHQVVCLPQGEFARFLRSDAGERAQLLQRLFGTDRFRRVEEWLAERRRSCAAEFEAAVGAVLRLAARVAQAAGVEEPPVVEDAPPAADWALEVAESAAAAAEQAEAEAEAADAAVAEAERLQREARELDRRQRRKAELLQRQAAVEQARPVVTELTARLTSGRRAQAVRSDLDQLARRRTGAERARKELERAQEQAIGFVSDAADLPGLREQVQQRRRRLAELEAAQRLEEDLGRERSVEKAAQRAAAQAEAEGRRQRELLETAPQRIETLRQALAEADAARLEIVQVAADQQRLERAQRDVAALDHAGGRRTEAEVQLLTARERAVDLREEAARLRVERFDFMIAELSAGLVDGDPCPVCGSPDHPDPSEVRGSRVTKEQEDAARAASDKAQQVVADLKATIAGLDAEIAGLRQALRDAEVADRDSVQLEAEAAELGARLRLLGRAANGADARRAELDTALQDERRLAQAARDCAHAEQVETERAREAAARAAELAQRLDEVLQGAADVRTARLREQSAIERIDALLERSAAASAAEQELTDAEETAARAVAEAGFPDSAAAAAALLDDRTMSEIERQVAEAAAAEAAVVAALADPELAVDLDVPSPLPARTEAYRAAQREARDRTAAAAKLRARATELARLAPAYAEQVDRLVPLRQRAVEVRQLADLAAGGGSNRLRMTLSAYVLAARLEEVASVASDRLRRMTQGRYTLVHTDAGRGNGRSGLGLLVCDAWTGQDRETATLSGGETFLTSLALALALGDVVTAESGGADIDALFIDEGFGSLDEQTLEEVMDTLDSLREGGRMVGLVSHVAELRMRIPAQIHVRKGRQGSSVSVLPG